MTPPSASLGSDGVTATLYEDGLELCDGQEHVWLTLVEAEQLYEFLHGYVGGRLE